MKNSSNGDLVRKKGQLNVAKNLGGTGPAVVGQAKSKGITKQKSYSKDSEAGEDPKEEKGESKKKEKAESADEKLMGMVNKIAPKKMSKC